MTRHSRVSSAALVLFSAAGAPAQGPLTTAFNYQGELSNGGAPVSGTYDLRFRLYDSPSAGTQLGTTLCADNVAIAGGRFAIDLDFGAQFSGQQRFLEIDVRQDTGSNCSNAAGFTLLAPRQPLSSVPHALYALNSNQLNGLAPAFYQNAANLTSGALASDRLIGTYASPVTFSSAANSFTGNGAGLTGLNATSLGSGTVADARLSTNIPRLNAANAFGNFTNSFLGNVGIGTASPAMKLTVAGDMELGTSPGDYRRLRIGGGNSSGFIYGSYPGLGDGIHSGYNWYFDAAGIGRAANTGGQTSRISTGYGSIYLATGGVNQAPINRLLVDQAGATYFLRPNGAGAGVFHADPDPGLPTFPAGTPFNSAGAIALYTSNARVRWGVRSRSTVVSTFPNQAEMYMDDATGTNRVSLYMAGEGGAQGSSGTLILTNLYVNGTKSFITPHPDRPTHDLIYYCLEGPENGIYLRGTSRLVAGRARVDLPDTFTSIASKEGLTVSLTPHSIDSRGLACLSRSIDGFDVGELLMGTGTYDFDWEIKAVRRGMRHKPVVVPWTEHAMGTKPAAELWRQRLSDIDARKTEFDAEDQELGPRP